MMDAGDTQAGSMTVEGTKRNTETGIKTPRSMRDTERDKH